MIQISPSQVANITPLNFISSQFYNYSKIPGMQKTHSRNVIYDDIRQTLVPVGYCAIPLLARPSKCHHSDTPPRGLHAGKNSL
jgi:hypothetical protein